MASVPLIGETSRVRSRTLVLIRWAAIAGQAVALVVVHFWLGFPLPLWPALAVVLASVILNLFVQQRSTAKPVSEHSAACHLAFDIAQLAALLYLTGGLENPFAFLLLAPVAVSATVLSLRSTALLCALSLGCITVLAIWHLPLPWRGPPPLLPEIYVFGVWAALSIGILFFASYTWFVAKSARNLSDGLAATQLALARERQFSATGALAAAAAHELGSPLATIAITAREMARDLPPGSPLTEDVALLSSEIGRCRDILASLAQGRVQDDTPFSSVPVSAVIETAAQRHHDDDIPVRFAAGDLSDGNITPEPHIQAVPEIIHGIGNLVQNAVQFAAREVLISISWSDRELSVVIADDGPGFSPLVLERIGEPYFSHRAKGDNRKGGDHMGLGIFIAQTLLARTGARLQFRNRHSGGAEVEVLWDRAILDGNTERLHGGNQDE